MAKKLQNLMLEVGLSDGVAEDYFNYIADGYFLNKTGEARELFNGMKKPDQESCIKYLRDKKTPRHEALVTILLEELFINLK